MQAQTKRRLLIANGIVFACGVIGISVGVAIVSEDVDAGMVLIVAGLCLLGLVSVGLPMVQWGAAGLLLTFGLVAVISGFGIWFTGSTVATATEEVNEDNDGDGKINEDPLGDADGSKTDPTKVDGLNEAQNHDDDDGDGAVDEDPAAPVGTQTLGETGVFLGKSIFWAGVVLSALFALILFFRARRPAAA